MHLGFIKDLIVKFSGEQRVISDSENCQPYFKISLNQIEHT